MIPAGETVKAEKISSAGIDLAVDIVNMATSTTDQRGDTP
jgi:hypothetical protein